MKLLVLGAGAIGGYFGGRLAEAGADVTFLVRPKRREQILKDGLVIESPLGNARIAAKTVVAAQVRPQYSHVLLTCKAYDLDSSMDAIAPAMAGEAVVVPLLNGVAHLARLDERFGAAKVMGGTCQINATLAPDGRVLHMEPLNRFLFGERDRKETARAKALAGALAKTTIDWALSGDIEQDLWEKVAFLSALAATTCLMRGNVAEIVAAPGGLALMERAIAANIAIATRAGHPPRPAFVEFARKRLVTPGPQSASMLRDLERGGPVEADHIVGWMLARAREYDVDDVILSIAYTHLKAYEARRAAERLPHG